MIAFVIQHHPYRTCANLRCEFVRCLTHHRPFLSGVRASGNPGAVHFLHEPLLPAPDARLGCGRPAHDLAGADPGDAQKHDLGTPDVLLRGVAILADPLETFAVRGREVDNYTTAHP